MEYWEFLLQKEGDRSWQPLKLPRIELEAGRYRVVVHSSRVNTDVEICVIHQSTGELPPKRRSQKRSRRTNPEGLMVVIPFTYLKAGFWELRCSGDIMSDFLGNSWQHTVQLHVLPSTNVQHDPADPVVDTIATVVPADLPKALPSSSTPEDVAVSYLQHSESGVVPQAEEIALNESAIAASLVDHLCGQDESQEVALNEPAIAASLVDHLCGQDESQEVALNEPTIAASLVDHLCGQDESQEVALNEPAIAASLVDNLCGQDESQEVALSEPTIAQKIEAETNGERQKTSSDLDEPLLITPAESSVAPELAESIETQDVAPTPQFSANQPTELANVEEIKSAAPSPSVEVLKPTNPILDQSLQMLEQILQQVLEPVIQDLERTEPQEEPVPVASELEPELEDDTQLQGVILTLEDDAFVARRGEPLTLTGQVDALDVHQVSEGETANGWHKTFQGTLRYELRDPQTSQILLNVQHPLPEQELPLTFSHTLDLPSKCKTRLILGKVTLCTATSVPLASQPFSVTADLDELLEAIIPGSKAMPVAKVLLPTNPHSTPEDEFPWPELVTPAHPTLLDLIDVSQNRQPLPVQPAAQQPLPPQIYQPSSPATGTKSLQLPNFAKAQSQPITIIEAVVATALTALKESNGHKEKTETSVPNGFSATPVAEPADTTQTAQLEAQPQELLQLLEEALEAEALLSKLDWEDVEAQSVEVEAPLSKSDWEDVEAQSVEVEAPLSKSDWEDVEAQSVEAEALLSESDWEEVEAQSVEADAPLSESDWEDVEAQSVEADALLSESDWEDVEEQSVEADALLSESDEWDVEEQASETEKTDSVTPEHPVDQAFQALNTQDRFWLRLNSLATDTELSEWLKFELTLKSNPAAVENVPPQPESTQADSPEFEDSLQLPGISEFEDVTQLPESEPELAEFDQSMWENESEEFESTQEEFEGIQEELSSNGDTDSLQPPLVESSQPTPSINWAAQEFVVEDDDQPVAARSEVKRDASGTAYPVEAVGSGSQPAPKTLLAQELKEPLPAPKLVVPTSELFPGEPMLIRVQLPPSPGRLCVKLWVQDRQSRSLLDGPRWLMDLIPDSSGELEGMTQLTVPFGSAELRFEAIAVDINNQRESHKVAVDCVVVPSDLPNISLDEFEA